MYLCPDLFFFFFFFFYLLLRPPKPRISLVLPSFLPIRSARLGRLGEPADIIVRGETPFTIYCMVLISLSPNRATSQLGPCRCGWAGFYVVGPAAAVCFRFNLLGT